MTVNDVIAEVETTLPNSVERDIKIVWLSRCERRIVDEALSRYPEFEEDKGFIGYDKDADGASVLKAPMPYDELYVHYIKAQIYLILHEQTHYNNEINLFNSLLADYKVYLNRRYRPGGVSKYRIR